MDRDICENRHGGNPESVEAFLTTPATCRTKQRLAIQTLAKQRGLRGITTDEVAQHFDAPPNSISGRLSELKRDGLLVETQQRRQTRMGKMARVLVAKEFAA
jgi:predicted ArsR family transcriptional regulator